jgi:hypothetical protein
MIIRKTFKVDYPDVKLTGPNFSPSLHNKRFCYPIVIVDTPPEWYEHIWYNVMLISRTNQITFLNEGTDAMIYVKQFSHSDLHPHILSVIDNI